MGLIGVMAGCLLATSCGKSDAEKRSASMDQQFERMDASLARSEKLLEKHAAQVAKMEYINKETARLENLSDEMKVKMRDLHAVNAEFQSSAEGTPEHQVAKERLLVIVSELRAMQAERK